jgi:methyl-accepting chemotaxis protein
MSRKNMRKRVMIDNLQCRLAIHNILYALLIVVVLVLAVFGPLIAGLWDDSISWEDQIAISDQFLDLHARIWPPILITLVFVAANSIIVAHRIAGPLYRFRQVLRAISAGDLSMRVKIRPRDYLDKEAEEFNRMIGAVRKRLEQIRDGQRKTQALIGPFEHSIEEGNWHQTQAAFKVLAERLEETGHSIDEFDL